MIDWNLQSRAHVCVECEAQFEDKQPYRTLLSRNGPEFLRLDMCEACWESNHGGVEARPSNFLSAWSGVYEAPPSAPPEAMQKETAEGLLRRLMELNDPTYLNASYILAVMLERKRVLKVIDQIYENGRRTFIYEHPKSGDIFTIPDPNLKFSELDEVQKQVGDLMEHGLPSDQPEVDESVEADSAEGDEIPENSADTDDEIEIEGEIEIR
jgi:hypothetical protein